MNNQPKRPPIKIRFQYHVETGETELIIDDNSPDRSEDYHDKVAQAIAGFLKRNPEIEDAGPIRYQIRRDLQTTSNNEQKQQTHHHADVEKH